MQIKQRKLLRAKNNKQNKTRKEKIKPLPRSHMLSEKTHDSKKLEKNLNRKLINNAKNYEL